VVKRPRSRVRLSRSNDVPVGRVPLTVMHVVVERSRVKSLACILGCAVFIVASLAIIAEGSAVTLVVGAVGVLTFAGFGIGWIVLLLRAGPALVVDDTGFSDRSSAMAVGRVLWSDVTSVSEQSIFRTPLIVVNVREPEAYVARLGRFSRVAARANVHLVGSPVTLASVGLKTSFSSLYTLLRDGFEQYRRPRPEA
jgi:hypothetical protein